MCASVEYDAALTMFLEDLLWVRLGLEESLAEAPGEVSPVLDNGVINAAALRALCIPSISCMQEEAC